MCKERFTPEFKEEAVRQIVEHGYSVGKVSARLGVSAHSLYKWVKAVSPDKAEKQASELLEAKSEFFAYEHSFAGQRRSVTSKKGREVLRKGPRVKYHVINEHRHEHKVATMC
jgi:transposase-like protein